MNLGIIDKNSTKKFELEQTIKLKLITHSKVTICKLKKHGCQYLVVMENIKLCDQ